MNNPFQFIAAKATDIEKLTVHRDGEVKLGETLATGTPNDDTKVVLLGIEEFVGPIGNHGQKGAENAFSAFLSRFVNMQDNNFLSGNNLCYIGKIIQLTSPESIDEARELVHLLDELIYKTIAPFFSEEAIVLVIGGGHNNAYPLIKAAHQSCAKPIDVINLDPHADCRKFEGRHSGNSFSTAYSDGILRKYSVLGLHKAYNSAFLLNQLKEMDANYTFQDDYLLDSNKFKNDILEIKEQVKDKNHGIELDMDAIAFMPSSAYTPSGFSIDHARWYVRTLIQSTTRYIHLTEGAATNSEEEKIVGKTLAYLAADILEYVSIKN